MTVTDSARQIIKLFDSFRYTRDLFNVFSDWLECAAISVANSVDWRWREKREARYLEIVKRYNKDEFDAFCRILAMLTAALEEKPEDVLGNAFMELELFNSWRGQFFTPIDLSHLMAEITLSGYLGEIEQNGFCTVNEPACGGGANIIGMANVLERHGLSYQRCMRVTAQDIDIKSVHMCYLQLSLLGIDAVVIRGDTLTLKCDPDTWRTPAHILRWSHARPKVTEPMPELAEYGERDGEQLLLPIWWAANLSPHQSLKNHRQASVPTVDAAPSR